MVSPYLQYASYCNNRRKYLAQITHCVSTAEKTHDDLETAGARHWRRDADDTLCRPFGSAGLSQQARAHRGREPTRVGTRRGFALLGRRVDIFARPVCVGRQPAGRSNDHRHFAGREVTSGWLHPACRHTEFALLHVGAVHEASVQARRFRSHQSTHHLAQRDRCQPEPSCVHRVGACGIGQSQAWSHFCRNRRYRHFPASAGRVVWRDHGNPLPICPVQHDQSVHGASGRRNAGDV